MLKNIWKAWVVKGYQLGCRPLFTKSKKSEFQATKIRQLFKTDILGNILSSVYIRSRYACEGENYRLKGTARCWRLAQQMLISWTKQQHHWFKKDKWKRKKDVGITVPEVLIMAKNTFNSPKQKLFNILPNKIKKTEESKEGEQLKQLLK